MPRFKYDFPYKKFKVGERTKLLPVIPIEIHNGDSFITYEALIDSGSEITIFPADLVAVLGINLKEGKPIEFGGVTGIPGKGYIHSIDLRIKGDKFKANCVFSDDIAPHGYGILGHFGFFNHFRVKFEYDIGNIELTPI